MTEPGEPVTTKDIVRVAARNVEKVHDEEVTMPDLWVVVTVLALLALSWALGGV